MTPPLVTKELHGGTQEIYVFPNGYGASVVCHWGSYGGKQGLKELAVITDYKEEDGTFNLCYDTPITSDVIGHLTRGAVDVLLEEIAALPKRGSMSSQYHQMRDRLMSNLGVPFKVKQAIREFEEMDPVDAMKATAGLADLFALRCEESENEMKDWLTKKGIIV